MRCRNSEISYRSGGGAFRFLSSSIFFRNSSNFGRLFRRQYRANLVTPFLPGLIDLRVALFVQRFVFAMHLRQDRVQLMLLIRREACNPRQLLDLMRTPFCSRSSERSPNTERCAKIYPTTPPRRHSEQETPRQPTAPPAALRSLRS